MKSDKVIILSVVVVLAALFGIGAYLYRGQETKQIEAKVESNNDVLLRAYHPSLGPADAKVTVVEFFDPECESCAAFNPAVKAVLKEYEGKMRLVLRYLPLHANSVYAASILEGARKQGKYWEALEVIFTRQPEWASHHAPKPELLMGYMKTLGLDTDLLGASVKDMEIQSKIKQDQDDARQLGVARTPSFFINGKMLMNLNYAALKEAVEEASK